MEDPSLLECNRRFFLLSLLPLALVSPSMDNILINLPAQLTPCRCFIRASGPLLRSSPNKAYDHVPWKLCMERWMYHRALNNEWMDLVQHTSTPYCSHGPYEFSPVSTSLCCGCSSAPCRDAHASLPSAFCSMHLAFMHIPSRALIPAFPHLLCPCSDDPGKISSSL